MKSPTSIEKIIDRHANRLLQHLPSHGITGAMVEFLVFGLKQAWACLFGGAILAMLIITRYYYPFEDRITRYDFLFVGALLIQVLMLAENIGTWPDGWLYPAQQNGWTWAPPAKLDDWIVVMTISFVLVTLVHRPNNADSKLPELIRQTRRMPAKRHFE